MRHGTGAGNGVFQPLKLSVDPRSGEIRRHHVHEKNLQNAVKQAIYAVGVPKESDQHDERVAGETMLSAGQYVSTAETTRFFSNCFYGAAAFMIALGVISILTASDAQRTYVAQLSGLRRLLFWPIRPREETKPKV